METGLERAIAVMGSNIALAKGLGVGPSTITNWARRGGIPAARVPLITKLTKIPPHLLRPDLFDPPAPVEAAA